MLASKKISKATSPGPPNLIGPYNSINKINSMIENMEVLDDKFHNELDDANWYHN